MAVAIRAVRKFERNEGLPLGPVIAAVALENQLGQRAADESRQELAQDDALIVPAQLSGRGVEHARLRHAGRAGPVDERVVGARERQVHLGDEHVRIVPRVADDGRAFLVPQHVRGIAAQQQLRGIVATKQVGMSHRPVAIEALEVQLWRSSISQLDRVDVAPDARIDPP